MLAINPITYAEVSIGFLRIATNAPPALGPQRMPTVHLRGHERIALASPRAGSPRAQMGVLRANFYVVPRGGWQRGSKAFCIVRTCCG